jgi:FlaA1/EpsC-like NDP-sugar epimerase
MSTLLKLIDQTKVLLEKEIIDISTFLVIGDADSIGQVVTNEIFKRNPKKFHLIDISENNRVELMRDTRSPLGYIDGKM